MSIFQQRSHNVTLQSHKLGKIELNLELCCLWQKDVYWCKIQKKEPCPMPMVQVALNSAMSMLIHVNVDCNVICIYLSAHQPPICHLPLNPTHPVTFLLQTSAKYISPSCALGRFNQSFQRYRIGYGCIFFVFAYVVAVCLLYSRLSSKLHCFYIVALFF